MFVQEAIGLCFYRFYHGICRLSCVKILVNLSKGMRGFWRDTSSCIERSRVDRVKRLLMILSLMPAIVLWDVGLGVGGDLPHQEGVLLQNPDPMVQAGFGWAIAVDDTRVLVGAPYARSEKGETGKAYLFQRSSGRLLHTFVPPVPAGDDLFGLSVGLAGDFVVIGAPQGRGQHEVRNGVVYLFESARGSLVHTVYSPNSHAEIFGHSLATRDTEFLVGDPGASSERQFQVGAAYLFEVKTGRLVRTFLPPETGEGKTDRFGHVVGFLGDFAVVSAPLGGSRPVDSGRVYVFDRVSGGLHHVFSAPDPQTQEYFGWSIAADGQGVVIGAPGHRSGVLQGGRAYVFNDQGRVIHTLGAPTPSEGVRFGEAVGIMPHAVIVGAPGAVLSGVEVGALLVFDRVTGQFRSTIVNPAKFVGIEDSFGASVAVFDDSLIVGSPFGGSDRALDAGSLHQYRSSPALSSPPPLEGP